MRARELQSLLKIADDLHKLAADNHNWCKENSQTRDIEPLYIKSGKANAYLDSSQRIIEFIKANKREMD